VGGLEDLLEMVGLEREAIQLVGLTRLLFVIVEMLHVLKSIFRFK